jgi:hypothetical protein
VKTKGKKMTEATIDTIQSLENGTVVTIGGKKFTVDIPADYPDQLWFKGARGGVNFLRGYTNREGLFQLVSWKSGNPVVSKGLQPLKVILMGNLMEDVTGKKVNV